MDTKTQKTLMVGIISSVLFLVFFISFIDFGGPVGDWIVIGVQWLIGSVGYILLLIGCCFLVITV